MTGRQGAGWPRRAAPHFSEAGWPLLRGLPFQKLPGLRAPSLPPPPCKVGPHLPPSGVPSVMVTWERMYRPGERHAQATKPAQGQTDMPLIGRMAMSKPCVSRLVTVRASERRPPGAGRVHVHEQPQTGAGDGMSARDVSAPGKHGARKRVHARSARVQTSTDARTHSRRCLWHAQAPLDPPADTDPLTEQTETDVKTDQAHTGR